ncbi:hypothetical protein BDW02DRAFT_21403 [Decorospora gaudefroyi]|uniref:Uncharacterized protein n=1 Tax=Decorospora gaudefroyi TaxID=184978 RepID=A0A6A5K6D0_9PLEO|nr:hypothetical protein BDW02DRAFT_21403 [Decorospora gaudefroyi]
MASSTTPSDFSVPPAHSHIRFGATPHRGPLPRYPSSYSHQKAPRQPAQDFDHILPQKQMKSMADLDKEEELRLRKSHCEKAKKLGLGVFKRVVQLAKGGKGGGP